MSDKREHFELEPLPAAGREWVKKIPETTQKEFNSRNASSMDMSHELNYENSKKKLVKNPDHTFKSKSGDHD